MASLTDVWGMYMGLKDRRRQKEQDDLNLEKYAYQKEQNTLTNDYRQQTLADSQVTQTLNQNKFDAQQEQQVFANEQATDAAASDKHKVNQRAMQSVMTGFTQAGGDGDAYLADGSNLDQLNKVARNSAYLAEQVQAANPDFSVAGIQRIPTSTNKDGSKEYRYALMIDTGKVDQERNPILKPLSATRGTDDSVITLGATGTIKYIENAILADNGSTSSQQQANARILANGTSATPEILTGGNQGARTSTGATDVGLAVNDTTTDVTTQNDVIPTQNNVVPTQNGVSTTPLANNDVSETTPVVAKTVALGDQTGGRSKMEPNVEEVQAGRIISNFIETTDPEEYPNETHLEQSNYRNAMKRKVSEVLGVSRYKAGQLIQDYESNDGMSGIKPPESLRTKGARGLPKNPQSNIDAPYIDTSSPAPIKAAPLTVSETKGLSVSEGSLKTDGGVTQAIVNKASTAAPMNTEEAYKVVLTKPTTVDNSIAAQNMRAEAMLSLTRAGAIPTPSAAALGYFVKTHKMGPNTTKTFAHGDYDVIQELDGFGSVIATSTTQSATAKNRIRQIEKDEGASAAALETKRLADVDKNWKQASTLGSSNAGGGDLDAKGEFGTMIGTVPKGEFETYFRGLLRSNDNHVQSVLPKGMYINALTGSNGELGVLAALAKSTASALKEGTFKKGDFTQFTAGDWMQVLKRYPPAASSGIYVYGNQIHSVDVEIDAYMKEFNISEAEARAELKESMSRKQRLSTAAENDR